MAFLLAGFTSAVSEGLEWRDSGGYFSSVLIFICIFRKDFYKLNPLLCKGVATPVDNVITCFFFYVKVSITEGLYQRITAMAASLPVYEVASSVLCLLCCILKNRTGFLPEF